MIQFKIKDGTRPDIRLCDTCRYATIMKGGQQGEEAVYCMNLPVPALKSNGIFSSRCGNVPFKVTECSHYASFKHMTEWEANQIGWVLEIRGTKVGFAPPSKKE